MLFFSLFFIELLILFLLSRSLSRILSYFFYNLTHNKTVTIYALAILFFPGTVIHELSHALSASLLGVRVGTMEFIPTLEGERVKLGSVQIAQTDPIRRFFIGAAPFIFGTAILLTILYFAVQNNVFTNYYIVVIVGYAVFEIGNTMFSSKKDMEGAFELFATLITIIIVLYLLGVRIPASNPNALLSQPLIKNVFKQGSYFLLFPLIIDSIIILFFKIKK